MPIAADLGGDGDVVRVHGTNGADRMVVGASGLSLDPSYDGGSPSITHGAGTYVWELHGEGGRNTLDARGSALTGGAGADAVRLYAGDLGDNLSGGGRSDVLVGGAGADTLEGLGGDDDVSGGDGADKLTGGSGNDTLSGGAGSDQLLGNDGNDTLRGADGEADALLNGAQGQDTAYYDVGVDTAVVAVEIRNPA
jgi:Ca2+-binding RTX toxin-like protein